MVNLKIENLTKKYGDDDTYWMVLASTSNLENSWCFWAHLGAERPPH